MHELTLAESVIDIVESNARQAGASRVSAVGLALGLLAQVDVDALLYCCELVAADGVAANAVFTVERRPGQAWCEDCRENQRLSALGVACPACGGYRLTVNAGEEMQVVNIAVA